MEMPTFYVTKEQLEEGIPIWKLFVMCGLCKSGNEARRLIEQGGAYILTWEEAITND